MIYFYLTYVNLKKNKKISLIYINKTKFWSVFFFVGLVMLQVVKFLAGNFGPFFIHSHHKKTMC